MLSKLFLFRKARVLIGLLILIAITGLAVATNSRAWRHNRWKGTKADLIDKEQQEQPSPQSTFAVDRAQLDHHVVRALDELGNRFESTALGRSIVTATWTRNSGEPRTSQLTIIRELPDKLRVDETSATSQRTFGYDGSRSWVRFGPPSTEDLLLIESFVRDSVEHFITGQARGNATFHLGDMFRSDDGSNPNYSGPYHDILRVDDAFETPQGTQNRPTLFYLNSRTGLPEKIVYERQDDSARVEVEFGEWITIANQKTPGRIVWKENGTLVNQLAITQVVFAPVVGDGIFNAPSER